MTQKTLSVPGSELNENEQILDIETTGRYWRTSRLTSVALIAPGSSAGTFTETVLAASNDEEEYRLLNDLRSLVKNVRTLVTYNGKAFDIPYLNAKYKAYGLVNPLAGAGIEDLFLSLSPIRTLLGLPSRRLRDLASPLEPVGGTDAEQTLRVLTYRHFLSLLDGRFRLLQAEREGDLLQYRLGLNGSFAGNASIHDAPFHLTCHGTEAGLGVHVSGGQLRVYHTDTANYRYLPEEGYAVHVSVARYVDKSRKEKAVRTNCFHLVPYSDAFLTDEKRINSYLRSVLSYLRSAAHSRAPSSTG